MGITTLALVAPGDTITSAQQNISRTNFGVLDSRTGGDPGAAGKFLRSNGATSAAWVAAGLLTDDIATAGSLTAGGAGTFGGNVGISGTLGVTLAATFAAQIGAGSYTGGSTIAGVPSFLGLNVGATGVTIGGSVSATGNGAFNAGVSISAGNLSVAGVGAGAGTFTGAVGAQRMLASVADAVTPPYTAHANQASVVCTNVKAASAAVADAATTATTAANLAGVTATATPTASKIPIADASGKLDGWVTASAGIPSGFIGAFETLAELTAAGVAWARYTAGDGRLLVGAGTTFSQTFTEATNYGSAWTVTPSGTVTVVIANHTTIRRNANIAFGAGTDNVEDDHGHGITSQTFTGSPTTYLPPMRGVIMARHV